MFVSMVLLASATFLACAQSQPTRPLPAKLTQEEFVQIMAAPNPPLLLDVRSRAEYAAGHIPGAIVVPHDSLAAALPTLNWQENRPIVVYCRSGRRTQLALSTLQAAGFTALSHLAGDMNGWQAAQQPIEAAAPAARQTD
jgi:rhodanese-related sulfurtransferase